MSGSNGKKKELVKDIMARHKDEWVLFEVCSDDEYGQPYEGVLLGYSPDEHELHALIRRSDVRHFAIWYAGELIPEGCEILL